MRTGRGQGRPGNGEGSGGNTTRKQRSWHAVGESRLNDWAKNGELLKYGWGTRNNILGGNERRAKISKIVATLLEGRLMMRKEI